MHCSFVLRVPALSCLSVWENGWKKERTSSDRPWWSTARTWWGRLFFPRKRQRAIRLALNERQRKGKVVLLSPFVDHLMRLWSVREIGAYKGALQNYRMSIAKKCARSSASLAISSGLEGPNLLQTETCDTGTVLPSSCDTGTVLPSIFLKARHQRARSNSRVLKLVR